MNIAVVASAWRAMEPMDTPKLWLLVSSVARVTRTKSHRRVMLEVAEGCPKRKNMDFIA
jgi:hypothetical protein